MFYPLKVNAALAVLEEAGIGHYRCAPLLHRFLWCMGITVPPPHLASTLWNAIFFAICFSARCGAMLWLLREGHPDMMLDASSVSVVVLGMVYGVGMAWRYRLAARKYNFPRWINIKSLS